MEEICSISTNNSKYALICKINFKISFVLTENVFVSYSAFFVEVENK